MKKVYYSLAVIARRTGLTEKLTSAFERRPGSLLRLMCLAPLVVRDLDRMVRLDWLWMSFSTSRKLETWLSGRRIRALEWGGGSSTFWLLKRCLSVVTIEHDRYWAEGISKLGSRHRLILMPPQNSGIVASGKSGFKKKFFDAYVDVGRSALADAELILIDGRARIECLKATLETSKEWRLILLDNPLRARYLFALLRLRGQYELDYALRYGLTPGTPFPTASLFITKRESRTPSSHHA